MISYRSLSPDSFVVLALPMAVLIAVVVSRRRDDGRWRAMLRVALAAYAVLLIALLFGPFPIPPWTPPELEPGSLFRPWPYPWANVIPFDTIGGGVGLGFEWPQARLLVGNVIAFAPVGMFVGLFRPSRHTWRRTLVTGLAISLTIEVAQLALSLLIGYWYRVADIDDLILNTSGALLGYGAFRVADAAGRTVLPARLVFWRQ